MIKKISLQDLATLVNGSVCGDGTITVWGLNPQGVTEEGKLCMIGNADAAKALQGKLNLPVLTTQEWLQEGYNAVIVENFRAAQAKLLGYFEPVYPVSAGISPLAFVHPDTTIHPSATIGPFCVIEAGATIGEGTHLVSQVYIGHEARVGAGCVLHPFTYVARLTVIGDRCLFHPHVTIGADGFGIIPGGSIGENVKVPQIGRVVIGDDVELGAGTCIDRGAVGDTTIASGVKMDNQVQIGHNNTIGRNAIIASQSGVAGSCDLGAGVILAARAGVSDHITIGDDTVVMALAGVTKDIPSQSKVSGFPAQNHRTHFKEAASLRQLPELVKRVAALEKKVELCDDDSNKQ